MENLLRMFLGAGKSEMQVQCVCVCVREKPLVVFLLPTSPPLSG